MSVLPPLEYCQLAAISGISPHNPRREDDTPDESLCASLLASGQLQPLLVHLDTNHAGKYLVLDGQRRWRAMVELQRRSAWPGRPVAIQIIAAPTGAIIEAAVAANTIRAPLHPVDEYTAFAAMTDNGLTVERIANDFGLPIRHVRQRLALGSKLSPAVLASWRRGDIDADQAQAFCAGATFAAQDQLLDDVEAVMCSMSAYTIRNRLRSDAINAMTAKAIYLGEAPYIAAGGRIEEDLFADETIWLDGALARRLADEKLKAEAEAIAEAEGWGIIYLAGDQLINDASQIVLMGDDYTDAEQTRLSEIEESEPETDEDEQSFEAEVIAIDTAAMLRKIPAAERSSYGIAATIDPYGRALIERGWQPIRETVTRPASASDDAAAFNSASSPKSADPALKPEPDPIGKSARVVLEQSLQAAITACIVNRPDIALMFAVARLGTHVTNGCAIAFPMTFGYHQYERSHPLLIEIERMSFAEALAVCADAPLNDLTTAMTELIAHSINLRPAVTDYNGKPAPMSVLSPIIEALGKRSSPMASRLVQHFEYAEFFDALPRKSIMEIVERLGMPGLDKKLGKDVIAAQVASCAKESKWLPEPLATWAAATPAIAEPELSLAEAMIEALDAADEAERERNQRIREIIAGEHAAPQFAMFLIDSIVFRGDHSIKASDLREAYIEACPHVTPLTPNAIGKALADLGIEKKRKADGIYYVGISMSDHPVRIPEAAE